jgi:hypothetical protein
MLLKREKIIKLLVVSCKREIKKIFNMYFKTKEVID